MGSEGVGWWIVGELDFGIARRSASSVGSSGRLERLVGREGACEQQDRNTEQAIQLAAAQILATLQEGCDGHGAREEGNRPPRKVFLYDRSTVCTETPASKSNTFQIRLASTDFPRAIAVCRRIRSDWNGIWQVQAEA